MIHTWQRDQYRISTDKKLLDLAAIHELLKTSYWAPNRPLDLTRRAIEHSLAFGMYDGDQQIGFGRIVTDYALFAYLCDVIIDERYRGAGLGKWLIDVMLTHPDLQGIRRWTLVTKDAQGLYQQYGFKRLAVPDRHMERIIEPAQPYWNEPL